MKDFPANKHIFVSRKQRGLSHPSNPVLTHAMVTSLLTRPGTERATTTFPLVTTDRDVIVTITWSIIDPITGKLTGEEKPVGGTGTIAGVDHVIRRVTTPLLPVARTRVMTRQALGGVNGDVLRHPVNVTLTSERNTANATIPLPLRRMRVIVTSSENKKRVAIRLRRKVVAHRPPPKGDEQKMIRKPGSVTSRPLLVQNASIRRRAKRDDVIVRLRRRKFVDKVTKNVITVATCRPTK